jgi:hypothetical protein
MDYTPLVLKNKGVGCKIAKVKPIPGTNEYEREYDESGNPAIESVFVRFSNNIIADIEEHWGGLDAWQESLEKMPVSTVRKTLSFALKMDSVAVGEAMLDGEVTNYSNIIGVAWAIANGVDPTAASRLLEQSVALAEDQKKMLNEAIVKQVGKQASPGDSGTQPGPKRAARTKSSGN